MATTTSTSQYPEPPPYEDIDAWVRYYRDFWGINTVPAPTQDKGKDEKDRRYSWIPWQPYQNQPTSDETQESYIRNGEYTSRQSLGLLPGKVWFGPNNGKWLVAIDGDNETAKNACCEMFGCETLEQVAAKGVVVEQHQEDAPHKAHFYFYSDTPFHNLPGVKSRKAGDKVYEFLIKDNKFPAVEIKCAGGGVQYPTPSMHADGYRYRQTAGSPPVPTLCLSELEAANVMQKLENILNHYGDSYLEYKSAADGKTALPTIEEIWKPEYRVTAGNNRHLDCRRVGASQLIKSMMVNKEQSLSETLQWNKEHCEPPLSDDDVRAGFYKYSVPFADNKLKERAKVKKEVAVATATVTTTTTTITAAVTPPTSPLLKGFNDDFFECLIHTTSKTVKQEDTMLRQIFYTFLSSWASRLANNLSVRAPSSEGKSYPILEARNVSGEDEQHIITINHITPKALIYQSGGYLVDKNGKPIKNELKQLNKEIGRARASKRYSDLEDLKEARATLLEGSAYVLELTDKCFLLLEPPKEGLWDLLKAILSHDKYETRHMMTDKGNMGMETKTVILKGFPSFIFCSAKDESRWEVWDEVQTRFMFVSPNMIPQKYREGNLLIAEKFGLPNTIKHRRLVSPEQLKVAHDCYNYLKYQIKAYNPTPESSPVWIPYLRPFGEILLPANKGSDNRAAARLFQILTIITLCRAHLRHKVVLNDTGEQCVIATLEDLREALHITQNVSGIPPHKLRFYANTIIGLVKKREKELHDKGLPVGKVSLTSTEITDFYNESLPVGAKKYTTDSITKVFLDELHNYNYLEKQQDDNTNRQRYYYYPIVDVDEEDVLTLQQTTTISSSSSSLGRLDKKFQFMRLMLPKNAPDIPQDWLKLEFLEYFGCRVEEPDVKIRDKDGNEIPVSTFLDSYETSELNLSHFYKRSQDELDNIKTIEITKNEPEMRGAIVKIIIEQVKTNESVSSDLKFDQLDKGNGNGKGGSGGISIPSQTRSIAESQPSSPPTTAIATTTTAVSTQYIPSQPAQQRQMLLVEVYELERQEQAKVNNEDKTLRLLNEQRQKIPPDLRKLYESSVSVDPEWVDERLDGVGIRRIYAMSFVDWQGREQVFHINDYEHLGGSLFERTRTMLNDIFAYWFENYRMSFGFNSLGDGSDREVIFENAQHYNTTIQPVEEQVVGSHPKNRRVYYKFKERELRHTHIDWRRIFKNKAVCTYIFEQKYRTFGLDTISRALFNVGKYGGVAGWSEKMMNKMSTEEQKMYTLQDSRLLSLLTTAENGNLFGAMQFIADLLELPLAKVCHSQVAQYWTTIYEKMGYQPPQLVEKTNPETGEVETIAEHYYYRTRTIIPTRGKNKGIPKVKVISYSGGRVLEPTPGFYRDVIGLDQESQYPTVSILLNTGFETMCCSHAECKDDPKCQIKDTGDPEIDSAGYYICKLVSDSAYKQKLTVFREARLIAKENEERVKDLALKIIINAAYGVWGYKKFPYGDTRIAETITCVARKMHRAMEELAKSEKYKFNVIGGDTDSILITHPNDNPRLILEFCKEFRERFGITVKPSKKVWSKMLITKKKHYIYWEKGNEDNPTIKGMEAAKNNMPKLTNIIFDQFVKNIGADRDVVPDLKRAWLKEYPYCKKHRPDLLQIEVRLDKNPTEYAGNKLIKGLGIHQRKKKDDTIRYYEIGKENEAKYGLDTYLNPEYINDKIYKQKFFVSPFKAALEQLGYNAEEVFNN